ncbi:MAG: hypothetical protein U0M00_01700 [Clostridia bacterium]|nr:hypothetical protein [Clostridia bacterium]
MIIVSQDKDKIFNFDNVSLIFIQDNNEIWVDTEKTCNPLGKYHTKERTKEVLQDIVNEYGKYLELKGGPAILQGDMDIQPNIFNIPKVYYMPEE